MAKTYKPKKEEVNLEAISVDAGKVPPQAPDVEEAVLGALLLDPEVAPDVLDALSPECFYKEVNRKIFEAIKSLTVNHNPTDYLSVAQELKKTNSLEEVGGPFYLSQLANKIGAASHVDYHVKILLQKYIQRELIKISYQIQKDSFDDSVPVDDLLDKSQESIFSLTEKNVKRETLPIREVIASAIEEIENNQKRTDGLSGVPSGYTGIDRVTLGWQASDMIIIAARPAMGKTAFVLTMARNMAVTHHVPVAFFSLEMSSVQLAKRLLISETGLSSEQIRGGKKLKDFELIQLNERIKDLSKAPLYIDDTPGMSIYEFRSKARKQVRQNGVKLIIIDYLQLMTGPVELRGMREQEVSNISRSLKGIAKELNIPIIALSQLSRAVETRGGNKRPQLSDLRESGAIEQDADIVMFIHRPEYYGMADDDVANKGLAEIIIAKHRNGSTENVNMKFRASEAKFVDADEADFGEISFAGDGGMVTQRESSLNSFSDAGITDEFGNPSEFGNAF